MADVLRVPEVAAGATEAVLSEWLISEGAAYDAGDPVVMIETDKAVVEVEAETSAVLLRILVADGSSVEVGSPVALVGDESERESDADALLAELGVRTAEATPAPERREVPDDDAGRDGDGSAGEAPGVVETDVEAESPEPDEDDVPEPATVDREGVASTPSRAPARGRVFVSPIARKMLREAGLDTGDVEGTGPHGRIVRKDVEAALAGRRDAPAGGRDSSGAGTADEPAGSTAPASTGAADAGATRLGGRPDEGRRVPHSRLRRAIARRLTESKTTVPHFYLRRSVRLDPLLELRADLNQVATSRISVNDMVVKAVAVAHTQVPEANVVWTEDALVLHDDVDVAVAVASERGLVTPVLRSVDGRSLGSISATIRDLVAAADGGTLRQDQLEGGTVSVSNLGMYGVDEFAAIINPPQSMILAVGAGKQAPVVSDGRLEVGTQAELVLSVDHRAVDGALAAQWMAALVDALEQPMRLLV